MITTELSTPVVKLAFTVLAIISQGLVASPKVFPAASEIISPSIFPWNWMVSVPALPNTVLPVTVKPPVTVNVLPSNVRLDSAFNAP